MAVNQWKIQESSKEGWRDGSAVKSTDCSSRGPEFNSQQTHGGSQPFVMGSDALFWCVWSARTHTYIHSGTHAYIKYNFLTDLFVWMICLHVYLKVSRGHWIPLQMVVSHHVVAGNWTQDLWKNTVLLTAEPSLQPQGFILKKYFTCQFLRKDLFLFVKEWKIYVV